MIGEGGGGNAPNLSLYIQRFLTGTPILPTKPHDEDAGWDLYASREAKIGGNPVDVHTDIAIAIPVGWYGHILPRSSTLRHYGIQVTPAVIDSGYRGELFVQARCIDVERPITIQAGQRIAQILFLPVPIVGWDEVDTLPEGKRGNNGFGSTGK